MPRWQRLPTGRLRRHVPPKRQVAAVSLPGQRYGQSLGDSAFAQIDGRSVRADRQSGIWSQLLRSGRQTQLYRIENGAPSSLCELPAHTGRVAVGGFHTAVQQDGSA